MARIEKDEDICYIPHDYIMTSDVAKSSEIGQKIIASKVDLRSKHSYLASYLLQEERKDQIKMVFIHPYYRVNLKQYHYFLMKNNVKH